MTTYSASVWALGFCTCHDPGQRGVIIVVASIALHSWRRLVCPLVEVRQCVDWCVSSAVTGGSIELLMAGPISRANSTGTNVIDFGLLRMFPVHNGFTSACQKVPFGDRNAPDINHMILHPGFLPYETLVPNVRKNWQKPVFTSTQWSLDGVLAM